MNDCSLHQVTVAILGVEGRIWYLELHYNIDINKKMRKHTNGKILLTHRKKRSWQKLS